MATCRLLMMLLRPINSYLCGRKGSLIQDNGFGLDKYGAQETGHRFLKLKKNLSLEDGSKLHNSPVFKTVELLSTDTIFQEVE